MQGVHSNKTILKYALVCGLKPTKETAAVGHGQVAQSIDYPWHIGIYDAKEKKILCGGTLISFHAVVSGIP